VSGRAGDAARARLPHNVSSLLSFGFFRVVSV